LTTGRGLRYRYGGEVVHRGRACHCVWHQRQCDLWCYLLGGADALRIADKDVQYEIVDANNNKKARRLASLFDTPVKTGKTP